MWCPFMTYKSKFKGKNKYENCNPQIKVNGKRVELGGSDEMLCHIDWQWHRYLEQLITKPDTPNPFNSSTDPELVAGLKARGYIAITRAELLAKRDEYVARLEKGEEPYSDKLHGSEWIENPNAEPVKVLINRTTGEWQQVPAN